MAVGKGSMARASKAAGKKAEQVTMAAGEENVLEVVTEAVKKEESPKETVKKATPKKSGTKKTAAKKDVVKTEETKEVAAVVLEATSEQVMKEIVYQRSSQVLDREVKDNETFGVGEAMPIYFY